jgi:hypothetical protein
MSSKQGAERTKVLGIVNVTSSKSEHWAGQSRTLSPNAL